MPDTKISDLASAGTLTGTELIPVVQGGATAKTTFTAVQNTVVAAVEAHAFTATGGTTAATLAARFGDQLNVKRDFGAAGDGTTDDSVAFQTALTAAAAAGKVVYVPAGTYVLASGVTAAIGTFIRGAGTEATKLLVTGTNGIVFTGLTTFAASGIGDLSIHRTGTGGYGVKFDGVWVRKNTFRAENLQFRGSDGLSISAHYFDKYIWILNSYGTVCHNIHIWGNFNPNNNPVGQGQSVGIFCDGDATGVNNGISLNFNQCNLSSCYTGIFFDDGTEGFWINGSEMVGCHIGVDVGAGNTDPGGWIIGMHANCTHRGVRMNHRVGTVIGNLSAYRSDDFYNNGVEDWAGIELLTCVRVNISNYDCAPQQDGVTTTTGITMTSCQGVTVNGGTLRDPATGLNTSACNDVLYSNIIFNGSAGPTITSAFKVSSTCNDIYLGQHSFIGTNPTTKYDVSAAASPYRIHVHAARPTYNGTSGVTSLSVAGTDLLTLDTDAQVRRYSATAGVGVYTYNIDLDTAGALEGDTILVRIAMAASTNPTVVVRNGSGGATLETFNVALTTFYACQFVYTGSAWVTFSVNATYSRLQNVRYSGADATASISAAATNLLSVGVDSQSTRFSLGAGAGPYTYNLDLDTAGALEGDVFKVWIAMPSSTNATAVFRNGSAGATLHTLNTASATRYACEFHYTGSAWVVFAISVTLV